MNQKKLKIAFPVSTFLPDLGGAEVGVHNIALNLIEKAHKPVVIMPKKNYEVLKNDWNLPYEIIPFPSRILNQLHKIPWLVMLFFRGYFSLLQYRYKFDFWHGTMGFPIGVALINYATKCKRNPHLVRCTGDDIQIDEEVGYGMRRNKKIDKLVRAWLPKASNLIAITESVVNEYKKLGIDDSKIKLVPNGVNIERFNAIRIKNNEVREKYKINDNKFIFLCVGRNHPKKNYYTLLKAAEILYKNKSKEFVLVVAGLQTEELTATAKKMGIIEVLKVAGNLTKDNSFHGVPQFPSDELVKLYKSADAFVFPSLIETFGIVLVEAMAAGLPIITSDAPGCRDVIRLGEDGIMVRPESADMLAEAMYMIMNDQKKQKEYSCKSIDRAKEYSWSKVVDSYISIYTD